MRNTKRIARWTTVPVFAVAGSLIGFPGPTSSAYAQIANPSFETGDFTGWTLFQNDVANPSLATTGILSTGQTVGLNDVVFDFSDGISVQQTFSGLGTPIEAAPSDGDFEAVFLQNGLVTHRLYQTVSLPADAEYLAWDMAYKNFHPGGFDALQRIAVHVRDLATDAILDTIFETGAGADAIVSPMEYFAADVTAYAGSTVRIDIEIVAQRRALNVEFDNLRVATCGDGSIDPDEDCDDGGESAVCDADCTDVLCGDTTVNATAGEDCDDGGESATCDVDCTSAACGDGTINTTAGETCDDGGESTTCDSDCSSALCGDGTVNQAAAEECDDSGESATCDADCTLQACGDGTVNAVAGEDCDDGGESATCDADCSSAICGDGVVNTTAGEECDDGNTMDGDSCTGVCQLDGTSSSGCAGCSADGRGDTGGLVFFAFALVIGAGRRRRHRAPAASEPARTAPRSGTSRRKRP